MGVSLLTSVLDLVDAVPVDYMHTVLFGIVKLLLTVDGLTPVTIPNHFIWGAKLMILMTNY